MKEKIKKYWWIIIVILIIGGVFYWFQWRPGQIRKECNIRALKSGIESKLSGGSGGYDLFYRSCLRDKGLEK